MAKNNELINRSNICFRIEYSIFLKWKGYCQQLPAPYKRLDDANNKKKTKARKACVSYFVAVNER